MINSQTRIIGAIVILLMLGASPLSVSFSFAENESDKIENEELRAILTEKVVDGKLEVRQYVLPEEIFEADLKRMLSLDDQISWAYVNYKMYQSGIILFDGKVSKMGEDLWKISIESDSNMELIYKIVFSGKITETREDTRFVISFINSTIKNSEITQNVKFLQIGESIINSEKLIDSNQTFRNSIR